MSQSIIDPKIAESNSSEQTHKEKSKRWVRLGLYLIGGAIVGYGYYRLVGCRSGTCPITSSPYISTIYGAFMGFLLSGAVK